MPATMASTAPPPLQKTSATVSVMSLSEKECERQIGSSLRIPINSGIGGSSRV